MSDAPDQIWIDRNGGNWSPCSGGTQDVEYRRADLPPTLSAAMELPEVRELVETAQWARNRLEIIADESWHGDGRDLKRSIIGVFADFDKALADCGSQVPLALAAIKEPKT